MKQVNVYFTGSTYNDCIGNGLFQIIFYTFDNVNLTCEMEISENDKELIINHGKLFNTEISFSKISSDNFSFIKKIFIGFLSRLRLRRFINKLPSIILKIALLFFYFVFYLTSLKKRNEKIVILSPMDLMRFRVNLNKQKITLIVADLLFYDFPEQFDKSEVQSFVKLLNVMIKDCSKVVCFSNHVKNEHLINKLSLQKDKIEVIPHTLHDFSKILDGTIFNNNSFRRHAKEIIRNCNKFSKEDKRKILNGNYLLSASTLRKNYKGIKTLESLLPIIRDQQIKILATHVPEHLVDIFKKNGNITPNYKLDTVELAAVYVLSKASIHFSFFEGGVNVAPFSEGVSLGTPCIFQKSKAIVEANLDNEEFGMFDASKNMDSLVRQIDNLSKGKYDLLNKQVSYYKNFNFTYNSENRRELWLNLLSN